VLIVGAGLGGLALARGLQRLGIHADVFERAPGPDDALAGYGIHLDEQGWKALTQCLEPADMERLNAIASHAGTVLTFRDEQLNRLADVDAAATTRHDTAMVERRGIGRMALRSLLLDGGPRVQWNRAFSRYVEDANGVTVVFEDGSEARGDVLVGADASNSRIRRQRLPGLDREDLGVVAIAGRYSLDEKRDQALPPCLRDGSLNNIVPTGEAWMFVSAWLLGDRQSTWHGENSDYVVWAYIVDRNRMPGANAPMEGDELRDHVLEMTTRWSPALRSLIRNSDPATVNAIELKSMPHLPPWPSSRVTLMGDAIHNMTPMAGVGANTALRDAAELSARLADEDDVLAAIGAYEATMRTYANPAVALSRDNAHRATKSSKFGRHVFRGLLRAAQAAPPLKRMMFAKAAGRSLNER
jgi:2-polyprenyl-6-methoxyphenol hydroxylase-like FAD-dependent oxidoreductase